MTTISSDRTWLHKRIFPVIWFGALGAFLAGAISLNGIAQPLLVVLPLGMAERVALSDIVNINVMPGKQTVITIRLRQAGRFGMEIGFMPASTYRLNPFAKNAVAEALIVEVDRARTAQPGARVRS